MLAHCFWPLDVGTPGSVSESNSEHSIRPLFANRIIFTIQLPHCHRLGIQRPSLHVELTCKTLRVEVSKSSGKDSDSGSLHAKGPAHHHQTMPHDNHLVQLNDLHDEAVQGLQQQCTSHRLLCPQRTRCALSQAVHYITFDHRKRRMVQNSQNRQQYICLGASKWCKKNSFTTAETTWHQHASTRICTVGLRRGCMPAGSFLHNCP